MDEGLASSPGTALVEHVEAGEVLDPGALTLGELADGANREHALMGEVMLSAAETACRAGKYLLVAKGRLERGAWGPWLAENFDGNRATAARYMKAAKHETRWRAELGAGPSFAAVRRFLMDAPREWTPLAADIRDEILRLRETGMTLRQICEETGVSRTAVREICIPGVRERRIEAMRRRQDERRALERQEREREIKRAFVKAGEALNEIRLVLGRLDGLYGQARSEATSKERRLAINEAHALRDKLMEATVKAAMTP